MRVVKYYSFKVPIFIIWTYKIIVQYGIHLL